MPTVDITQHHDPHIEVSFSMNEVPADFMPQMKEAYKLPQDERIAKLRQLVMNTTVMNGGVEEPMIFEVWRTADALDHKAEIATSATQGEHIVVRATPDGEVDGVFKHTNPPIDVRKQDRAMLVSKRIGWGPPQNDAAPHGPRPLAVNASAIHHVGR